MPGETTSDPTPVSEQGTAKPKKRGKKRKNEDTDPATFRGDRVLAGSIAFICDGMNSREFTYAVAEGDVGRVYESMKVSLIRSLPPVSLRD